MDEDIDIEEHDLLDNPALKNIFPDLSVIKTEISTFIDDATPNSDKDEVGRKSAELELSNFDQTDCKNSVDLTSIDCNNITVFLPSLQNEYKEPVFSNKIILGSRPNQEINNANDHYENNVKPFSSVVKLNDINSFLTNCARFCRICNILFPQSNLLITHMEICHKKKGKVVKEIKFKTKSGVNAKFKCEVCDKYFTQKLNLRKHMRNIHKQRPLVKNNDHSKEKSQSCLPTNRKQISQTNSCTTSKMNAYLRQVSSTAGSVCFHCKRHFPSQKNLIEHIYKILQSPGAAFKNRLKLMGTKNIIPEKAEQRFNLRKKNFDKITKTQSEEGNKNFRTSKHSENTENIDELLYKCCYCSYYLTTKFFYAKHLSNKHKESNVLNNERVVFDPKCKFCSAQCSTFYTYNIHLQMQHKNIIEKTIKIEPVIYLTKVDSFLEKTKNEITEKSNIKNIERNVNDLTSKSTITDKKRNYEDNNEDSANGQMLVLKNVLFRCTRCDIHFLSSKTAMNHLEHMEMLINWKCLVCSKIFKKNDEIMHSKQHDYTHAFTVYELNELQLSRILYKCSSCAIHFSDSSYLSHYGNCGANLTKSNYCNVCDILIEKKLMNLHEREHKSDCLDCNDYTIINSDVILNSAKSEVKIHERNSSRINPYNKLCFCNVCKCFLTQFNLRDVHKDGRCANVVKIICKDCGLLFTNNTFKSHKKRHKINKDLKLQDFIFYDLSGKHIRPPIPEYPKCKSCSVHFNSKNALINHVCEREEFLTCPVCEIKLSDTVFKLHVSFHQYSLNKKKSLNAAFEEHTEKWNPQSKNDEYHIVNSAKRKHNQTVNNTHDEDCLGENSGNTKKNQTVTTIENVNNTQDDDECQSSNSQNKIVTSVQNINQNLDKSYFVSKDPKTNRLKEHAVVTNSTDLKLFSIIYGCATCLITVDTFDKAVEHCQDHYSNINFDLYTKTCNICKLKYDERYYGDHNILHKLRSKNKTFTHLKFDTFYFCIDYKYWIQNIFEAIEPRIVLRILDHSVYKIEGRVKLRLVQEGLTDLVVYKCSTCCVYVDPDTIISHSENSCFRQRIHPCSYCGLPFISHVSRLSHEMVHKEYSNITARSYKIMTFDREKDWDYIKQIMDARNTFILYKCRECDGIFERYQCRKHLCNKNDLKKCITCRLLFYSVDYKSHTLKHTIADKFIHRYMRIIFFGRYKQQTSPSRNSLPLGFDGIVSDYEFYQCTDCCLSFKKAQYSNAVSHDCTDSNKIQCKKCGLLFLKKYVSDHMKQHDTDIYFIIENFNLIPIKGKINVAAADSTSELNEHVDQISETTESGDHKESPKNDTSSKLSNDKTDELSDSVSEKIAKIYKCKCGLHFLEIDNIRSHFGHCASRISKQVCSKCGLFFTPKELFTHLLKHHGDKKNIYKMDVINMSQEKNEVIQLFKCSVCSVNFLDIEKAKEHFKICENSECDKRQCQKCSHYFHSGIIDLHENTHHADNIADLEITLISDDEPKLSELRTSDDHGVRNLISQADAVSQNTYSISRDKLAQISLESYSDVIYKCAECNVHFLVESTFRRHLAVHEPFLSAQDNCSICGLNFSIQSLEKHKYIHHEKMKLNLVDFVIVTETISNSKE